MDKKVTISSITEHEVMMPYLGDYNAGFHIRQIAKDMKMNHRTVALALSRLERQGIVKHRTEGRNKVYFLNPDNPMAKGYIIQVESYMAMKYLSRNPLIGELYLNISHSVGGNALLILFGSYARGEETKESDIDLMTVGGKKITKVVEDFGLKYGKDVQIQALSPGRFEEGVRKNEPLFLEIAAHHIVLNNYSSFVDIMWRHYYG